MLKKLLIAAHQAVILLFFTRQCKDQFFAGNKEKGHINAIVRINCSFILPVNGKRPPGLAHGHYLQAVYIDMRRQAAYPVNYISYILSGERPGARIHFRCALCIPGKPDERKLGFSQSRLNIGYPDRSAKQIRPEII